MAAAQISAMRRHRSAKLHRDPALAAHVVARLKDGWSPEQIAARGVQRVCGATRVRSVAKHNAGQIESVASTKSARAETATFGSGITSYPKTGKVLSNR